MDKNILYTRKKFVDIWEEIFGINKAKLKPYNVLAVRLSGASDEMWRLWAEKRFLYELYMREMYQREGD